MGIKWTEEEWDEVENDVYFAISDYNELIDDLKELISVSEGKDLKKLKKMINRLYDRKW